MRLFLLYVSLPYEGGYVYGVYSTEEAAQKHINDEEIMSYDEARIKEITLNEFIEIDI